MQRSAAMTATNDAQHEVIRQATLTIAPDISALSTGAKRLARAIARVVDEREPFSLKSLQPLLLEYPFVPLD
jgi:hypothetical protein